MAMEVNVNNMNSNMESAGGVQPATAQPMPAEPVAQMPPQQQNPQTPQTTAASLEYVSFLTRFVAVLIDGILISIVMGILGTFLTSIMGRSEITTLIANILYLLIIWGYSVIMANKYGATLGKMVLGIKIQHESTGQNLTMSDAFLREVVGKSLSTIALFVGYLWMLWDPKKQTWHDKIAHSIVVKAK